MTSWVVEGVFGELAELYFDVADLLVWLDIDWLICKTRLEERGSKSKIHLGREQSEEGLRRLLEWGAHYYDRRGLCSFDGHKELMKRFSGKKLHLRSPNDVQIFIENAQQNDVHTKNMINIETKRLLIRDHIEADLNTFHQWISDTEIMTYLDWKTKTLEESKQKLDESIAENNNPNRKKYFFSIIRKEDNSIIGETGFTIRSMNQFGGVAECGYFLLKQYWGYG